MHGISVNMNTILCFLIVCKVNTSILDVAISMDAVMSVVFFFVMVPVPVSSAYVHGSKFHYDLAVS